MNRGIILIIAIVFVCNVLASIANAASLKEARVEPGIYVFVSFSMNDESLRHYFKEAEPHRAKLVMRGLVGDKNSRNRFASTKTALERARINIDINPNLFNELNIKQVPFIVVVSEDGSIRKIGGHISLNKALELMEEESNNLK
jgi:conjugal transfer pilus assembly protein TrbC